MGGYTCWQLQDKITWMKINALLKDISRHPFEGEGNPEKLRGMDELWSCRINDKDRLVYAAFEDDILVVQCKGHYSDKLKKQIMMGESASV